MMINTAAAVPTPVIPPAGESTKEKIFVPLSKNRLDMFKLQLVEISREKIEVANHLKETLQENGNHVFGNHQEWGTDTQSTSVIAIQQDLCDKDSKDIEAALIRIQNGTYGKCKTCKGNIEEGRLEALPTTEICGDCSGAKRRA
jgi:RNA polymerase-binding transcription factor DksA